VAEYLTPEKLAKHARIRAEVEADFPDLKERARERHEGNMRTGTAPRLAINVLRLERNRQGLTDDEMMARSGLDRDSLASMTGLDARPTIETMEAYAKALGKRLLIVLAAAEGSGDEPATP
jgi:hypothetical protein